MEEQEGLPSENDDKKGIIQKIKDFYWALQPVFWTHHPVCDQFSDHTVRMFKKDLCAGCFVGIPSWALATLLGTLTGFFDLFSPDTRLYIGLGMMSVYLLSIFGITENKKVKVLQKIIMGTGAGFVTSWIFSLPYWFSVRFLLFMIMAQFVLVPINLIRYLKMKRKCKKCEWKQDWDNCPGFGDVSRNISELFGKKSKFTNENLSSKDEISDNFENSG